MLSSQPKLLSVNMSNNLISEIQPGAFTNMTRLVRLILSKNKITKLDQNSLAGGRTKILRWGCRLQLWWVVPTSQPGVGVDINEWQAETGGVTGRLGESLMGKQWGGNQPAAHHHRPPTTICTFYRANCHSLPHCWINLALDYSPLREVKNF